MRVTHQDIAEQLGISRAVVTKALHGTGGARVSAETRQAIFDAAKALGYRPRSITTHSIGYVLPVRALDLQAEVAFLQHVTHALRERGYRITLVNLEEDNPEGLQEMLSPKYVDGAIFMRWPHCLRAKQFELEVPYVVTSDEDDVTSEAHVVTMNTVSTACRMAEHVLSFGHRQLALVSGPGGIGHNERIKHGVSVAMQAAGIDPQTLLVVESGTHDDVHSQLVPALRTPGRPTAVIVDSPEKAVITLSALWAAGLRVPQDISLAALLDNHQFPALLPPITATTALGPGVATRAVVELLARVKEPGTPARRLLIPGDVIQRGSVSPPNASDEMS